MPNPTDYISEDGKSSYKDSIKEHEHYATIDDICSEMRDKFMDFVDMSNASLNMSMAARKMDQTELAGVLAVIGGELATHAEGFKHILKNYGIVLSENEYMAYRSLMSRVQDF